MKKTIFYHDTDCGNVVYYANYLKFFEEARTLYMAEKGFSVPSLMQKGLYFVVAWRKFQILKLYLNKPLKTKTDGFAPREKQPWSA